MCAERGNEKEITRESIGMRFRRCRLFVACVLTALLGAIIIFAMSVFLAVSFFDQNSWLNVNTTGESPLVEANAFLLRSDS